MLKHKPLAVCAQDRRQFGRRTLLWHAWIVTSNKQRVACTIRNVSAGGALLELPVPTVLPPKFELLIEDRGLSIRCDKRHDGEHGLGVSFVDIDKGRALFELSAGQPRPARPSETKADKPAVATAAAVTAAAAPMRSRLSPELIAEALRRPI